MAAGASDLTLALALTLKDVGLGVEGCVLVPSSHDASKKTSFNRGVREEPETLLLEGGCIGTTKL